MKRYVERILNISVYLAVAAGISIGSVYLSRSGVLASPQIAAPGTSVNSSSGSMSDTFADVAERSVPAVVTIGVRKTIVTSEAPDPLNEFFSPFFGNQNVPEREEEMQGLGSGVIIKADGYILTNNHVVGDADELKVTTYDGHTYKATVVGADPKTDIAVIKIDAHNLPTVPLGNSDVLRVGEWVLAIGSPFNPELSHTVTSGIVSAKGRKSGIAMYEDFIQTDAAINPGNSGGALLNLHGELVGINTAIISGTGGYQGIGFAVPVNLAAKVMEQLVAHGEVTRGWLGVVVENITESRMKALGLAQGDGVLIADVLENSPATKAGIKPMDVIVEFNGAPVPTADELRNLVADAQPGAKVPVNILRNGKYETLEVVVEKQDERMAVGSEQTDDESTLGVTVENIPPQMRAQAGDIQGVVVSHVKSGSPAAAGGLMEGDVIRWVNNTTITSVGTFKKSVSNLKHGEPVVMNVYRQGMSFFIDMQMPLG